METRLSQEVPEKMHACGSITGRYHICLPSPYSSLVVHLCLLLDTGGWARRFRGLAQNMLVFLHQ